MQRILAVGESLSSSRRVVALARRYEMIYAAVGIHPHRAAEFERDAEETHALLREQKVVAVGEIGLDYSRDLVPADLQRYAFETQLGWAHRYGVPASVHNRDADTDVLRTVVSSGAQVILHCFSGDREFASKAVAAGCLVSFAGNVTFPKASALRSVIETIPDSALLVETDSPVLAPQTHRGRRNEPSYIQEIMETVASARSTDSATIGDLVRRNAETLFRWSAP